MHLVDQTTNFTRIVLASDLDAIPKDCKLVCVTFVCQKWQNFLKSIYKKIKMLYNNNVRKRGNLQMSEIVKKLVKETWLEYFSGNQKELEKRIDPKILNDYQKAMLRLETDFDFQAELGIGI